MTAQPWTVSGLIAFPEKHNSILIIIQNRLCCLSYRRGCLKRSWCDFVISFGCLVLKANKQNHKGKPSTSKVAQRKKIELDNFLDSLFLIRLHWPMAGF